MNEYRLAYVRLNQQLIDCQLGGVKLEHRLHACNDKLPKPLVWDPKRVMGVCDRCCCMKDMGYCMKWCFEIKPEQLMPRAVDSAETIKLKQMTNHACYRECNMKKEGYLVPEN